MLSAFRDSLKIPELRDRIIFTFGLVAVCRLGGNIPVPGVNAQVLSDFIQQIEKTTGGGVLALFNLFSGGAIQECAVFALGIMPYISATIILQLLTPVIPALERMAREGESGRQTLIQYGRYMTVALCFIQGWILAYGLENPASIFGQDLDIVARPGLGFKVLAVACFTAGTMLLMWFGEQITERGIGNGISLIITVNILARLPAAIGQAYSMFFPGAGLERQYNLGVGILLVVMIPVIVMSIIAITQAERKIPVQYAKRVVGRRMYGGQNTFLPLRINYAGVMPIIFADALMMFPARLLGMIKLEFFARVSRALSPDTWLYFALYAVLIFFFSYFWVATQFNPVQIADDLKRYGGYIPGVRPGKPTADYLDFVMTRITMAGAIFLTVIAAIPRFLWRNLDIPYGVASFFGGTGLLIIIGVMLDTMRQVESHLLMRHYDGFLRRGKLKGRF